jgi:N-carbamoylputrescine amidase
MPYEHVQKRPVTIALVQMSCVRSKDANVEKALARIAEAAAHGANVVCLQELFTGPYFCQTEDHRWFGEAEPIPGPTTSALAAAAKKHGTVIIGSLFERRAPGLYHNTAVVLDADGSQVGVYRKMHIPDDPLFYEKFYFTPGDLGFQSFPTKFGRFGVCVCWDQWYPEAARITSLLGAEIIFYPTAIGWHPAEKAEFGEAQVEAWRTAQRAHAIANGVFVAAPNRVGHEDEAGTDGIEFFGHSFVADPFGRILAEAGTEPAVLVARCDRSLIETTRRNWPFLRDRRIDAYAPILNRYIG